MRPMKGHNWQQERRFQHIPEAAAHCVRAVLPRTIQLALTVLTHRPVPQAQVAPSQGRCLADQIDTSEDQKGEGPGSSTVLLQDWQPGFPSASPSHRSLMP
jgi:hypothetical protein